VPRARLLVPLAAVALAGCGDQAISDNTNKKPTAAVKALLARAPAAECSREAPRQRRIDFVADHPELTDKQLAKLCPELYPGDYLTKDD